MAGARLARIGDSLRIEVRAAEPQGWARQDSNLGPTDYESAALTAELRALLGLAYRRHMARTFPAHSWLA